MTKGLNIKLNMAYPAISSETLFHFTGELKYLIDILREDFKPRFCHEILRGLMVNTDDPAWWDRAIPMKCFCDLPLSKIGPHLEQYGGYGIGLTKKWGKSKGITPILYIHEDSPLVECVKASVSALVHSVSDRADDEVVKKLANPLSNLINFVKPYKGSMTRDGVEIPNVRFYDEREWRYVPENALVLDEGEFTDVTKRETYNEEVGRLSPLTFTPDDVRYIVVKEDSEILPMMNEIWNLKGLKFDEDEVKKLQTRIISAEQIREDF